MVDETVEWSFYGYVTPANGRDVQDWFKALDTDAQDEARDVLVYLQQLPVSSWGKPEFQLLGDEISEIRFKVNTEHAKGVYRIYGAFWPKGQRYSYTFLIGKEKKVKNDRHGKHEALKRLRLLAQGRSSIHEFEFSEDADRKA
ncbi:MAG: type II toxin-antitoxin system RelE/ParE family toxin [Bryobacterales bacterium]|nr:type II toxin-antitoxin system RelE/ParE family toxin [Bryobacterales bacterium]